MLTLVKSLAVALLGSGVGCGDRGNVGTKTSMGACAPCFTYSVLWMHVCIVHCLGLGSVNSFVLSRTVLA